MASVPALDLRFAPGPGAGALQDFLYAELDAFEPIAIQEHESGDGWRVFFKAARDRDGARAALASEFAGALLDLSAIEVDDEDWARRSQARLQAIRVGRIVVAPPWDVPQSAVRGPQSAGPGPQSEILVVIDPSMGFGTGHHETTRLCLTLLQGEDLTGRRVIDVGTGSGVLAIAAWRLGADEAIALDNDPDALANARENVGRNGGQDAIHLLARDLGAVSLRPADVVLANLTRAVLQKHARGIAQLVERLGRLIVSGFGPSDIDGVTGAFQEAFGADARSCRVLQDAREGEWAALLMTAT